MSKKFTMLLASLFLVMGTLWAQPEVGKEYRIKEANQSLYLTIRTYNGAGETSAHGTVPLLGKWVANPDQIWTLEATGTANVYNLKSKSGYYMRHGGWNVNAYNNNGAKANVEFVSNDDGTYKIKNIDAATTKWWKSQSVNGDGGTWHPFCDQTEENAAASWALEEVSADEYALKMSTDESKNLYHIKNARVMKYASYDGDGAFAEIAANDAGSYWYFVDATAKLAEQEITVPDGYVACYIFNAQTGKAVQNHSNGFMNDIDAASYPAKIYYIREHEKGGYKGYAIHDYSNDQSAWNDGESLYVTNWGYDDAGSIWYIFPAEKTEGEWLTEAKTAVDNAKKMLPLAKESSYYTYTEEGIAAIEAVIAGFDESNITSAITSILAINNVQKTDNAPAAGDIIMLKNKNVNKYLIDNGTQARIESANKENKALWEVVAGENGIKLKNCETGRFLGSMKQSEATATVETETEAAEYVWTNPADVYAAFNYNGSNQYGHESWQNLVGWWDKNANASQWLVTNVRPLSITYLVGEEIVKETTEYAKYGTYNVVSPDFTTITSCTVNGEALGAVEGVYSFDVTAKANVAVTVEVALPFDTTTVTDGKFADDTEWYVVNQKAAGNVWTYNSEAENNVEVKAEDYDLYNDAHLWCFTGNVFDGFKAYNKAAGVSFSLDNEAPAKLVANNDAVWYVENSTAAFGESDVRLAFKRAGNGGDYANLQGTALNKWGKDAGSTSRLISATAELAAIAESKATLTALVANASAIKDLLVEASATTLNDALATAEPVSKKDKPSKSELDEQITALSAAFEAVRYITSLDNLRSAVGYTIATEARGAWYSDGTKMAVNGTVEMEAEYSTQDVNMQFAFIKSTTTNNTYLYSVAQKKFVKAHNGYTTFTEYPEAYVKLLESTGENKAAYPWVVEFNGEKQVHFSTGYSPDAITSWNNTSDAGNMVRLEVAGTFTLDQTIEEYEIAYAKSQLLAEITEATALVNASYIGADVKATLNTALEAAQAVYDNTEATYEGINAEVATLAAAIETAAYVTSVEGFSNNAIYTFVAQRSDNAYLMYDGENAFVASPFKNAALAENAGEDKANCQWAVYKSEEGNYYMYNLGAEMFMGLQNENNQGIPFSATPQTTTLKFQATTVATHPIMISSNGGAGAVNQSNNTGFTDNYGAVNWNGGFSDKKDLGNVHKVKIAGMLEQTVLDQIAATVATFEREDATEKFESAISELEYCMTWLDAGYYSTTDPEALAKTENFYDWKANSLESATLAEIKSQTDKVNELIATFSVVPPVAGKFYRISHDFGGEIGVQYIQAKPSGVDGRQNALLMTEEMGAASIFYYAEGKLLSYSEGLYVNETGNSRGLQSVDTEVNTTIDFGVGTYFAEYTIKFDSYLHANKTEDGVCYVDHCSGNTCEGAHLFTVEEVTSLPVKVGAAGYATFYTPVDMVIPEDVTASIVTGLDGNVVVLEKVEGVVPAHTGLILEGEAKDYEFAIATTAATANYEDNLLDGTTARTLITAEDDCKYYVLGNKNSKVALYLAELNQNEGKAFINNANKAYLPVVVSQGVQEAPAMFSFGSGGEGTTSIEDAELTNDNGQLTIYDLTGRRIEKVVEKGIYIVNGKKVVIK